MGKGWPKGKPRAPHPNRYKMPREPLMDRLLRLSLPEPNSGCWLWMAALNVHGYGYMTAGGKARGMRLAHRVAHELFKGPIPEGLVIDHLCRNIICCNPDHLEAVTQAVNIKRGLNVGMTPQCRAAGFAAKAAITHCPHGHEYSKENTAYSRGKRVCKACRRKHSQRHQVIRTERARQARLAAKLAA